jgi:ribulose 1,5-bisphosphate carboxylase large subunit-like protein
VGLAGVEHLRSCSQLPIHAHRNGWGALTRHPSLGFDFMAYQKVWRLAGVDHLGGQMGDANYFIKARDGVARTPGAHA